jgi:hypothetical protein
MGIQNEMYTQFTDCGKITVIWPFGGKVIGGTFQHKKRHVWRKANGKITQLATPNGGKPSLKWMDGRMGRESSKTTDG